MAHMIQCEYGEHTRGAKNILFKRKNMQFETDQKEK